MRLTVEIKLLILIILDMGKTFGKTVVTQGTLHKIYRFPLDYVKPAEVSHQSSSLME